MQMAPFFDPLSGKWVAPPQPGVRAPEPAETLSVYELAERKVRLDNIWAATVASALACQIESAPAHETEADGVG